MPTRADTIQHWLSKGDALGLKLAQSAASAAGLRRATRLFAGREVLAEDTGSLSATGTGTAEDTQLSQPLQGTIKELRQRHLALMAAASQQSNKSTELHAQVDRTKVKLDIILASLIKGLQQPAVSMQLEAYSDLLLQVQAVVTPWCALIDHCCLPSLIICAPLSIPKLSLHSIGTSQQQSIWPCMINTAFLQKTVTSW